MRCSMRSLWAWTGATLGSPKLTGLRSTLGEPSHSAGPCLQNHDGHQAGTTAPLSTNVLSTRTPQFPAGEGTFAPRKVPRTLDDSALFDAFTLGLDGCNPRFAETHRSPQHPGSAGALAGPCLQNHDGHQAGTTAPRSTHCLSTRTRQFPAGEGADAPRKVP